MTDTAKPDSRFASKIFPSPNHGERKHPDGTPDRRPDMLILHYTGMPVAGEALQWLCNPVAQVSSHYFVFENGHTLQLVPEGRRAWHAGASHWAGETDINSCSIGIEIANPGDRPFPEAQMAALEALLAGVMARWSIPAEGVIAHSDMAPERKIDPGPRFDWHRLARQGLSVWPGVGPAPAPDAAAFRALLLAFGYPDLPLAAILPAFRMRFRPGFSGPPDTRDMAIAADLAARFGEDGGAWRAG